MLTIEVVIKVLAKLPGNLFFSHYQTEYIDKTSWSKSEVVFSKHQWFLQNWKGYMKVENTKRTGYYKIPLSNR